MIHECGGEEDGEEEAKYCQGCFQFEEHPADGRGEWGIFGVCEAPGGKTAEQKSRESHEAQDAIKCLHRNGETWCEGVVELYSSLECQSGESPLKL